MTTTIQLELPAETFSALRMAPEEFAKEMKLAACVQWYNQGLLSQSKACEVAGLSRVEFLLELSRRNVPILQTTEEELVNEVELLLETRR